MKLLNKLHYFFLIIACLSVLSSGYAQDFYVSPEGNDQANGLFAKQYDQTNGPYQTLARAQSAVRALKTSAQFKEPVIIHIGTGIYSLDQPLVFDLRDSGVPGREIIWQADNGPVILTGGKPLSNCENTGQLWTCPVTDLNFDNIKRPADSRKKSYFSPFHLYINEHRYHLARWPDTGWAHIKQALTEKTKFSSFQALPVIAQQSQLLQIHIFASNDWLDQYLPVAEIDSVNNQITLQSETAYPILSGRRFYLQNIRSELNAEEEWFYDNSNNRVLFITAAGAKPERIIISALNNLISISQAGYISFRNLTLRYTTDAAISIKQAHHIKMDGLEINNVDASAIEAIDSNNISIINNHIHDIGEGGISMSGGERKTLKAANNIVHNNYIHDFANLILTYCPAVETRGVGSFITHNLIDHGSGGGVTIGGNDHLLEKNEISHVCEQAADCGAVYDGRNWTDRGNVIRYNSLHDIYGYAFQRINTAENTVEYAQKGAVGVYLDDGMSGVTVYGNIFNNAGSLAIQLGGGRDNIIQNNVFFSKECAICVDARWPEYVWSLNRNTLRDVPYLSKLWRNRYPALALPMHNDIWPEGNTIKSNIIISNKQDGPVVQYILPAESNDISNNIVWSTLGNFKVLYNILDRPNTLGDVNWQDWINLGVEKNSVLADPCVSQISSTKVSFCSKAPLAKIGFQALPEDIGVIPQR